MSQSDLDYYRKRAAQERRTAIGSSDGAIARVHSQMADAYDNMVLTAAPVSETPVRIVSSGLIGRS